MADRALAKLYTLSLAKRDSVGRALDDRRKRLLYRSSRRGSQEADLLLGHFARHHVPGFSNEQLDRFENLTLNPDADLLDWNSGRAPVPEDQQNDVMRLWCDFTYPAI